MLTSKYSGSRVIVAKIADIGPPGAPQYFYQKKNLERSNYCTPRRTRKDFLKQIIENIHSNINYYVKNVNANSDDYVYQTTGPDFVTQNYIDYKNKKSITILDNGKRQCFGDFATHKCMGSWK